MPAGRQRPRANIIPGAGGPFKKGPPIFRKTISNYGSKDNYGSRHVTGITYDATGAVLGSCDVDLFLYPENVYFGRVVSDASTGAYDFPVPSNNQLYFTRCYKAGTPVFGTSDNTLIGRAP